MDPLGTTRSHTTATHALLVPDCCVATDRPGWTLAQGSPMVSPRLGSCFVQYLATLEPEGRSAPAAQGVERFVYVTEGEVVIEIVEDVEHVLGPGGFLFLPAEIDYPIRATTTARLSIIEKRYAATPGVEQPKPIFGQEQDIAGMPYPGGSDASFKALLPDAPTFDLAVNLFTFQPGATLPTVEVHAMEHVLLMLEGQGVHRLGDDWYPSREGDLVWSAPFCPRWFVAMGKGRARFLDYQDVTRDPLELPE